MNATPDEVTISAETMEREFLRILIGRGMSDERASLCASLFTTNTLDGVFTHGVYRFRRFVNDIDNGHIHVGADASHVGGTRAFECWHGHYGPGPVNAINATRRAMELARAYGLGCVALAHANHWMRGGRYGWIAASEGFAFIGWTNTTANLPAWGARDARLGNNPLVLALPHKAGPVVLDMAMSQYSYGTMELAAMKGDELPFAGGYDANDRLTTDPAQILHTRRSLPIGYWKGAGLSLLLDMLATALSGGLSTAEISGLEVEKGVSQVYVAVDLSTLPHADGLQSMITAIIDDYCKSQPVGTQTLRYPGERARTMRARMEREGIPVLRSKWEEIVNL